MKRARHIRDDFRVADGEHAHGRLIAEPFEFHRQHQRRSGQLGRIILGYFKALMSHAGGARRDVANDDVDAVATRRQRHRFLIRGLAPFGLSQFFRGSARNHRIFEDAGTTSGNVGNLSEDI